MQHCARACVLVLLSDELEMRASEETAAKEAAICSSASWSKASRQQSRHHNPAIERLCGAQSSATPHTHLIFLAGIKLRFGSALCSIGQVGHNGALCWGRLFPLPPCSQTHRPLKMKPPLSLCTISHNDIKTYGGVEV